LHIAVREGDVVGVQELVARGAKANLRDTSGKTPLLLAEEHHHVSIAAFLRDYLHSGSANANMLMDDDRVELVKDQDHVDSSVAGCDKFNVLEGREPKKRESITTQVFQRWERMPDSPTALHMAVNNGETEQVKSILAAAAEVDGRDETNFTALHVAATTGHIVIIELLLEHRASVLVEGSRGQTPAHRAATRGNLEVLKLLLDKSATVDAVDSKKQTMLHRAAYFGKPEIICTLLDHKAAIEAVDSHGQCPLHCGACAGHLDVITSLLERRACMHGRGGHGQTPLQEAVAKGWAVCVRRFLDYHAQNADSIEDVNAGLHKAVAKGFTEIVQMLVEAGDPMDRKNEQGFTALHIAVSHSQHVIAKKLLAMRASVDARIGKDEKLGWTSLHWASSNGCNECVDMLLKYRCALNLKDVRKRTPLDLAVSKNHTAVVSKIKEAAGNL